MLPVVLLLAACAAPVPSLPPSARPTTSSTPTVNLIPTATPGIINLHMFTPAVGWAQRQSDGAILHTTNGVLRWGVAAPGIGTEQIIAVAFVDADAARLLAAVVPSPDQRRCQGGHHIVGERRWRHPLDTEGQHDRHCPVGPTAGKPRFR
jgi:hypothetical protein